MKFSDLPRSPGIYLIRNQRSGKVYVGSAVNIRLRIMVHRSRLVKGTHPNAKLLNAWRKYGPDAFTVVVICLVTDKENLANEEQKQIDLFNAADRTAGYNLNPVARNANLRPRFCLNCNQPTAKVWRGRCHACDMYLRRRSIERPYIKDGRAEKPLPAISNVPCKRCGRSKQVVGRSVQEYCRSCCRYLWAERNGKIKIYTPNCLYCGVGFRTKWSTQKYCCVNHGKYYGRDKRILLLDNQKEQTTNDRSKTDDRKGR